MPERQDPVFRHPGGGPSGRPCCPQAPPSGAAAWAGWAWPCCWYWPRAWPACGGGAGREQSLAQTLAVAQRWLPAGMQLEVKNAQGSLRFGGEIDRLRISNQRFTLQIKNLTLAWNLGQLLQRRLAVERLHAARVDYRAQPEAPPDDTPSQPLRSLQLPLAIDLPVQIDTFTWADGPSAQLEHLAATYRYDREINTVCN